MCFISNTAECDKITMRAIIVYSNFFSMNLFIVSNNEVFTSYMRGDGDHMLTFSMIIKVQEG